LFFGIREVGMFETVPKTEREAKAERVRKLYTELWLVDNVTAVLMDVTVGSFGLHEAMARAKAHAILDLIQFEMDMEHSNPDKRAPDMPKARVRGRLICGDLRKRPSGGYALCTQGPGHKGDHEAIERHVRWSGEAPKA
jgi:hypothetical protein